MTLWGSHLREVVRPRNKGKTGRLNKAPPKTQFPCIFEFFPRVPVPQLHLYVFYVTHFKLPWNLLHIINHIMA